MRTITIGNTSTTTWGIVTNLEVKQPSAVTRYVTVPGRNGKIDASEALMGYPTYDDRTIIITMAVYPHNNYTLDDVINSLVATCHGKRENIYINTDYHFVGRMSVGIVKEAPTYATATITCTCDPYEYKNTATSKNITAGTLLVSSVMPTKVTLTITTQAVITRNGVQTTYSVGTHVLYPLLKGSETWSVASGTGTVSYTEGRL